MIFLNLFVGSFLAILSKIPKFDDVFDGEPPHKHVWFPGIICLQLLVPGLGS